jgi:hypothetical protein
MMQQQSKFIIGLIVTIFGCSAIAHTRRGWNNAVRTSPSTTMEQPRPYNLRQSTKRKEEEKEYVALDHDEAAELYGFSSMEAEFEWNKFQTPEYLEHIQEDEQGGTFYIVPKKDIERRLQEQQQQQQQQRNLKTYYHEGSYVGGGSNEYDGIYAAGDVRNLSSYTMSTLLYNHESVAFIKRWITWW